MSAIYFANLKTSGKIFKVNKILFKTGSIGTSDNGLGIPEKEGRPIILIGNNYNVQNVVTFCDHLAFTPNAPKKIYFPNFRLTSPNFVKVKDTTSSVSNFIDLKSYKLPFNKINSIENFPKEYLGKPIIIDASIYAEAVNNYAIRAKKTGVNLVQYLFQILKEISSSMIPSNCKPILTFYLDQDVNMLYDALLVALHRQYKDFQKLGTLFTELLVITKTGYVTKVDLSEKPTSLVVNNLHQMTLVAQLVTTIDNNDPNIEVIPSEHEKLTDEEKKSINSPNDVVVDHNDKEHADITASFDIVDKSKSSSTSKEDQEDNDNDYEPDEYNENPTDNDNSTTTSNNQEDDSAVDVDDIVDDTSMIIGSTEQELLRISKENNLFLEKNMHRQVEALSKLEKAAEDKAKDKTLFEKEIPDDTIISPAMRKATLSSITSSYYKKQFDKDILDCTKIVNKDPEYPLVVTGFKKVDASTTLSMMDEYTIEFVDKKNKKHSFVVDVPKLSHDGFLYINGSKKFIAKQALPIPVIKETNDRVQITTNHKKTFLYRKGNKVSAEVDRVLKLLINGDFKSVDKVLGDSSTSNKPYDVSIPYTYLSQKFFSIAFKTKSGKIYLGLNQDTINNILETKLGIPKYKKGDSLIPIALVYSGSEIKNIIYENTETKEIYSKIANTRSLSSKIAPSLVVYLTETVAATEDKELLESYSKIKPSLRLAYTEIKIVNNALALGVLVSMYKGLIKALELYNIKYRLESKRVTKSNSEMLLAFKDAYLYMDGENIADKELFINGIMLLNNTSSYSINETSMFSPLYLDYLEEVTGSRNNAKALSNIESSMIDPITLEILKELKLPENFTELLLYGNSLLGNLTSDRKNDMTHFRIRDSEVITVAFFNTLMDSFNQYKRFMRSGRSVGMKPKKDAVSRNIMTMANVEDYSTLNPFLEAENKSKATFKGPSGINSSDAYTADIRAYDETMLGLYGIYTPIGPEVGVNRSMALDPKLSSTRGFIDTEFDLEAANSNNLFSIGELLNPFTARHADSPRAVMTNTQGRHLTPTKVQHPYLVGNGSDKALAHIIGQDYAFKALNDGVITKIDTARGLVVVESKDGNSVININGTPAKNSGGGFYTENKLVLLDGLKVGSKVKKDQILAVDKKFFNTTLDGSIGFLNGTLTKVAMAVLPEVFEDSAIFTQRMVNDLSTEVLNERRVVLSKNTLVHDMVAVGKEVDVSDPLMVFEDVGSDEQLALKALEKLDATTRQMVEFHSRDSAKAKFTGTVYGVNIYYNCELDEMHPTLRALVEKYIKLNNSKAKIIQLKRDDEIVEQESTTKINSDKILGEDVDGVMIRFFIRHVDKFKVGDKACFGIALKTICAETVEKGLEPYSEHRKDESVDAIISPLSFISRMVPDFFLMGYTNKVIIELERKVIELLKS